MATLIEDAIRLIRASTRVAVAAHVGPDGDAIGSLLATGRILEWLGKKVALLCDDPVPARYRFLPGSEDVRSTLGNFKPDLLIGLDTNEGPRLGKAGHALVQDGLPTINLDHHITNNNFGAVNLVDSSWGSAAEGVLVLLDALGAPLDEPTATCLLTGVVTDTRGFRTANVTPRTLIVASRLMEAGADLPRIVELTLDYRTLPELETMGKVLSTVQLEEHAIWAALPFNRWKTDAATIGLSNMLLGVEGANVAAVLREKADGKVEISLRAAPGYDVANLAVSIGGGGHTLAAGATVDGPLKKAVGRVIPLLKQAARDGAGRS
jgi:phosphoesterase RecJ-like protein